MICFGLLKLVRDGAKGSGHFKHAARPGKVGGSVKSGASLTDVDEYLSKVGVKKGDVVKVFGLRKDVLLTHIQNCLEAGDGWWRGVFKSQEDVDKARQLKADMELAGVSKDDKAYIKVSRALARFDFVKGASDFIKGKIADSQGIDKDEVVVGGDEPVNEPELVNEPEPTPKEPEIETKEVPFQLQVKGSGDVNKFMTNTIKDLDIGYTSDDLIAHDTTSSHHLKERQNWHKENFRKILNKMADLRNNEQLFYDYMDLGSGRINTFALYSELASKHNEFLGLFEDYMRTGNEDLNSKMINVCAEHDVLARFAMAVDEGFKHWRMSQKQFDLDDYGRLYLSADRVQAETDYIKNWFNDLGLTDAGNMIAKDIELRTNLDYVPVQDLSKIGYFGKAFESNGTGSEFFNRDVPTNSRPLILNNTKGLNKKGLDTVKPLLNKDGSFDLSKVDDAGLLQAIKMAYVPNLDNANIKFDAENCYEGFKLLEAVDKELINFRDLPAYSKESAERTAQLLLSGYIYRQASQRAVESVGGVKSIGTSKVTINKKENEALFNEIRGLGGENRFSPFNWKPDKNDFKSFINPKQAEKLLGMDWDASSVSTRHPADLCKSAEANWNSVTKLSALDSNHGMTMDELKAKAKSLLNSGKLDDEGKGMALARRIDLYEQLKPSMSSIIAEAKAKCKSKKAFDKVAEHSVWNVAEDLIGLAYGDPNDPRLEHKRIDSMKKLMENDDDAGIFYQTLCKSLLRRMGVNTDSNPELLSGSNSKQQRFVYNALEKASHLGDIDNDYVNSNVEHEINRSGNMDLFGKVFKQFKNIKNIFSNGERGSVGYKTDDMFKLSREWQSHALNVDETARSDSKMFNEEDLNKLLCMMSINGGVYNAIKESNQYGARNLVASVCASAPKANDVVYRFEDMSDKYRDYSKLKVGDTVMLDGQHFTQGESFKSKAAEYFGERNPIGFKIEGGNCPFLDLEPHVWHNKSGTIKTVEEVEGLIAGFTKVKAITPEEITVSGGRKVKMNMVTLEYDWDSIKKFIQLNARDYANVFKMYGKEDDE